MGIIVRVENVGVENAGADNRDGKCKSGKSMNRQQYKYNTIQIKTYKEP